MRDAAKAGAGMLRSRAGLGGLAALVTLVLAVVLLPGSAEAAQQQYDGTGTVWRQCMDGAWKSYNGCLMESDGWFDRKVCDIAFQVDAVACAAKAAGEIKNAYNGEQQ